MKKYLLLISMGLSSCATLLPPPALAPAASPTPTAQASIAPVPVHFNIVHGLLEAQLSDQAGLHSFGQELLALYPGSTLNEYTQDNFDSIPFVAANICQVDLGNSWGGSAIFRRMDKNPSQKIALAVMLDPVPNTINQPSQALDNSGWRYRPGIGRTVIFRETASILKGQGLKPQDKVVGSIFHDDLQGFLNIAWPTGSEYVLDWDPGTPIIGDFNAHFTILTKHSWVKKTILDSVAKAVSLCK